MLDDFAALCLQIEWGADEALDRDPIDRLRPAGSAAPAAVSRPSAVPPTAVPNATFPTARPVGAPSAVRPSGTPGERGLAAASGAATLQELRAAVAAFDGCSLRDTASNLVFAEGDPAARVLLVGEPPGREEDRAGHPFAGAEGHLLDQMLASIELKRDELMLTHLLPWRPPGGRPPNPAELALCLPFLHRLIVLVGPAHVLLLGGTAARALLDKGSVRRRGARDWVDMAVPGLATPIRALALPSLADLGKTPILKRDMWAGLRMLRRALNKPLT